MSRDAWRRYSAEGSWRYDVAYPGFKYNMTDIAAAMGLGAAAAPAGAAPAPAADRGALQRAAGRRAASCSCRSTRPEVEHAWHLYVRAAAAGAAAHPPR